MKKFFVKENMLNSIVFTSVLLMATIKSILSFESLKLLTFALSILLLLWSITNTIISILERINDMMTENLSSLEDSLGYETAEDFCKKYLNKESDHENAFLFIQKCSKKLFEKAEIPNENLNSLICLYWQYAYKRNRIRIIRRVLIYFSCFLMILLLTYLFVASDINEFFKIKNYDLTIWTLIIVLFEFLIKEPFTKAIIVFVKKRCAKRKSDLVAAKEDNRQIIL